MCLAGEFLNAADTLATPGATVRSGRDPIKVPLYLYGHALELMAKAVLVCAGTDEGRLRRIGHDLTAAFRAAHRQFGAIALPLTSRDYAILGMLSPYYHEKDFEYLAVGFRRYPDPADVQEFARRLFAQLSPAINAAVRAWSRARPKGRTA